MTLTFKDGTRQELHPDYTPRKLLVLGFGDGDLVIPYERAGLLYRRSELVTRDKPVFGFVPFLGDERLHDVFFREVSRVEVTVFDGFGRRHKIPGDVSALSHPMMVQSLEPGITFTPHRRDSSAR